MPVVRLMLHFHGSINLSSSFDMLHSLPPPPHLAFCCHLFNICVFVSRRECAAYLSVNHNIQSATEHKGDSQHFIPNTTVYISVSGSFLNAILFTPQMFKAVGQESIMIFIATDLNEKDKEEEWQVLWPTYRSIIIKNPFVLTPHKKGRKKIVPCYFACQLPS